MTAAGPLWALANYCCSLPQDPGTRRQRRWTIMSKTRFCFFTSSSPGTAHQAALHSLFVGPTTAVPSTVAERGSSQQPMRMSDKYSMHMHAGAVDQDPPPFPSISPPITNAKTLNGTPWGKLHPQFPSFRYGARRLLMLVSCSTAGSPSSADSSCTRCYL